MCNIFFSSTVASITHNPPALSTQQSPQKAAPTFPAAHFAPQITAAKGYHPLPYFYHPPPGFMPAAATCRPPKETTADAGYRPQPHFVPQFTTVESVRPLPYFYPPRPMPTPPTCHPPTTADAGYHPQPVLLYNPHMGGWLPCYPPMPPGAVFPYAPTLDPTGATKEAYTAGGSQSQ